MTYKFAAGHDNTAGLAVVNPPPASRGVRAGRRTLAGDRRVYEDGPLSSAWEYTMLTEDEYDDLLTQFGLTSAASAYVTISHPRNGDRTFVNWNCTIIAPERPDFRYFWKLTFELVDMEALS